MGYFENLTKSAFKEGRGGEILFYKYGVFGKPYIVPSEQKQNELKKFLTNYYRFCLPISVISAIPFKWKAMILLPFMLIYYEIGVRKILFGLSKGDERLSIGESYSRTAKNFSLKYLIFGLVISALFTAGGVWMINDNRSEGWFVAIFFGLCVFAYSKMVYSRIKG
jgi:hypothetical protein